MVQQEKRVFRHTLKETEVQKKRVFGAMMMPGRWVGAAQYQIWHPPTDMYETENNYVVRVEIAGMSEKEFRISFSGRTLVVAGVREDSCVMQACHQIEVSYGEFRSRVIMPGPVDQERIEAAYTDGFLEIILPKKPAQKVSVVRG